MAADLRAEREEAGGGRVLRFAGQTPFKDTDVIRRVRGIEREGSTRHPNPDVINQQNRTGIRVMTPMSPRQRLMTAMQGGVPDRVPCYPEFIRWQRYHYGCTCPRHQLKMAEDFGFDAIVSFGHYVWQSLCNDYCYAPGGGFSSSALGLYGDLPHANVELRIENRADHVWYHRTFHTPAGDLSDVIQWARPNTGYGDGPNPHRVEPLIKSVADLPALRYLYPPPRKDLIAEIPLLLSEVGDRAVLAAVDNTHVGGWGLELLGVEDRLVYSLTEPELLRQVCRFTQNVHMRNLRAMLEQGIQVVFDSWFQCGLSVGWSPKTYEEFFLPLVRKTIDLAHEFGAVFVYYDAGKMMDIIPMVVEAGADVICGLQPPPDVGDVILKDAKARYGDRGALMGGLDACYVFDRGSPDKVREAARRAIADAGPGGGFVLGTAMAPSPATTAECLKAAVQVVEDFGVYGRNL
jgi:hypothetical protein